MQLSQVTWNALLLDTEQNKKTTTFPIFYIDIFAIDYYQLAAVMTFKDLKKFVEKNNDGSSINNNNHKSEEEIKLQSQRFEIFHNKFWISDIEEHKAEDIRTNGNCCFNHILGLPKKDGIEHKIYDYEMQLVNALDNHKSVFVKKARGLGITEILLRYMSWLAENKL